jgi:hypothetical protein
MLSFVDTLTCSGVCSWQGQKRSSTGRGVVLAVVAGAAVLAILALTAPQGNSLQQLQLARPAAPAVSWTSLSAAQQQALKTQVMESASARVNENERATTFDLFICMPISYLSISICRCVLRSLLPTGKQILMHRFIVSCPQISYLTNSICIYFLSESSRYYCTDSLCNMSQRTDHMFLIKSNKH